MTGTIIEAGERNKEKRNKDTHFFNPDFMGVPFYHDSMAMFHLKVDRSKLS